MSNKRRKTENRNEAEDEDEELLTDKNNSLESVRSVVSHLARNRNRPVVVNLKNETKERKDIDLLNPLKSLSMTYNFASNNVVERFEQKLGCLEYARNQLTRHPQMKVHYNMSHIDVLVNKIPSDLRTVMKALISTTGRMPSAILVKDPTGRMDIIFDTLPSSDYCCCSVESIKGDDNGNLLQGSATVDLESNIATILSLKNRVIPMDELAELFKDRANNHKGGNASTAKPAKGLSAIHSSGLFTPLSSDTGTADTFEKLFMKKLFVFTEMFQCSAVHLDYISPSGNSICHNKIVFSSV